MHIVSQCMKLGQDDDEQSGDESEVTESVMDSTKDGLRPGSRSNSKKPNQRGKSKDVPIVSEDVKYARSTINIKKQDVIN